MNLSDYLETPEKYIPDGMYCYNSDGICPFWESKRGQYPSQEDGYCHFLGKSDWDMNEEHMETATVVSGSNPNDVGKPLKEVFDDSQIDTVSGKKIHFGMSLLWDQCKECGINMDDPEDTEYTIIELD